MPRRVYAEAPQAYKEPGLKQGVIYRARKELEGTVVNTQGKKSPHNQWALAGDSED